MRTYNLSLRGDEPLYYYLYKQIRKDIMEGQLKQGERLPSKREMAEHLGISLITVENAYQMLKDEGYIESRERSGYYVKEIHAPGRKQTGKNTMNFLPEKEKRKTEDALSPERSRPMPYSLYFRTIRSVISEYGEQLMEKSPNEGCPILRNSIAKYLLRYRGIFAQPENIIIGSGAEHLYGCVARMLGRDLIYGIEDPSYVQIENAYHGAGARVEYLKMGKNGIETEALMQTGADVLHVTPFHSFPSGVTANITKRYEYLEWAKNKDRYIVEDDFDSEFFMPGKPIETLYTLDGGQKVIYLNTFSNSLSPSIRMGYMILPEKLTRQYKLTNGSFSCTVPVLEQYALAEFIEKGYFEQHLNRVRRQRRNNENI